GRGRPMSTEPEKPAVEVRVGEMPMATRSAYGALVAADGAFLSGRLQEPPSTVDAPAAPGGPEPVRTASPAPPGEMSRGLSPADSAAPRQTTRSLPPGEVVLPPTRILAPAPQ